MASVTKFNPDKFRGELLQLNPNDLADVATHWRAKCVTVKNEMTEGTENALEIGITGATAFGLSYLQGGWSYERQAAIAKWAAGGAAAKGADPTKTSPFVEGGETDPTKLMGIDKTLWATIVLGAASVFKLGGKKYAGFVRAGALGAMATWAGGLGHDLGHEAAVEAGKTEKAA
ncbi:MAG TPA: hypothetical protein VJP78_03550 [Thermoleophilia bacterium]|nr:hypothetical protein [Thermoleophilia bacterium]